jgi:RES domain-containing protein
LSVKVIRSLWRIATDTPTYTADDMTGIGAKIAGGRWNKEGVAMVYTSSNMSLACLETVVHLNAGGLPLNRYLVKIEVPEDVWAASEIAKPADHVGWDAEPAGMVSIDFGTDWVNSNRSVLLRVPSVIVPEEQNVLINPAHPDAVKIKAKKIRKWLYDPRLTLKS